MKPDDQCLIEKAIALSRDRTLPEDVTSTLYLLATLAKDLHRDLVFLSDGVRGLVRVCSEHIQEREQNEKRP